MIIAITNGKGGVGKSTIAVHLAVWLHELGYKVIVADCDKQQSSSEWIQEAAPQITTVRFDNPAVILNELQKLAKSADFVVADGPGSHAETTLALVLHSDLAIVPCKASMLEVRALAKATESVRHAQGIRRGSPKAVVVLSMVGKNYRLTSDMAAAAAELKLPLASTPMILRQIYADAPGQGAVVWQLGARGRDAAQEVKKLFKELFPKAAARKTTKVARGKRAANA